MSSLHDSDMMRPFPTTSCSFVGVNEKVWQYKVLSTINSIIILGHVYMIWVNEDRV